MSHGHYTSLRIRLPERERNRWIDGREARRRVSGIVGACGIDLPCEFFHRDANGSTLNGAPHVVFDRAKGAFQFVGIGPVGSEAIRSFGHGITSVLRLQYGEPLMENWASGPMSCEEVPYAKTYAVRSLFIQRPGKCRALLEASKAGRLSQEAVRARVIEVLRAGVVTLCHRLEIDAPEMLIEAVEYESVRPLEYTGGLALAAQNVTFRCNLDLKGQWYAGHLRSAGMGRIVAIGRS